MSGHETIRVLEVEVDASQPASGADGKREAGGEEGENLTLEPNEGGVLDPPAQPCNSGAVGEGFIRGSVYISSLCEPHHQID